MVPCLGGVVEHPGILFFEGLPDHLLEAHLLVGLPRCERVQLVAIRLVVLAEVKIQRFLGDVGLQGIARIGEIRDLECHLTPPFRIRPSMLRERGPRGRGDWRRSRTSP